MFSRVRCLSFAPRGIDGLPGHYTGNQEFLVVHIQKDQL